VLRNGMRHTFRRARNVVEIWRIRVPILIDDGNPATVFSLEGFPTLLDISAHSLASSSSMDVFAPSTILSCSCLASRFAESNLV